MTKNNQSNKENVIKAKGVVAKKHHKVLQKMSANVGKKSRNSISQAARDAGYSESYVRSGRLQKTKAWQQLIVNVVNGVSHHYHQIMDQ